MVRRYAKYLDAQIQELLMGVPPGRQVGNSRRAPIGMVELDQYQLFAAKIAQPDLPARCRRELEIRRPVAYLYLGSSGGQGQQHCKHNSLYC
jgi:hypothetical protein